MKIAAIFLVLLAGYAAGSPAAPVKASQLDRGLMETVQQYLGWTNNMGNFLTTLNQFIVAKMQQGGEATTNMMAGLVSNTLGYAESYKLVSKEAAQDISATFGLSTGGQPLEASQIAELAVAGNEQAASDFKAYLQVILADQQADVGRMQVLRKLEGALTCLLRDNAKMSALSVFALKNYFDIDAIVDTVTHPVQAVKTVATFIKELQPKVAGLAHGAQAAFTNLQSALYAHANAAAKFSMGTLENLVSTTINYAVACETFDEETGNRLLVTFGQSESSESAEPLTAEDITGLTINANDAMVIQFKVTIKELVELKNKGTMKVIVLGGLGASVLNLIADKAMIAAATIKPLLRMMGLSEVVEMLDAGTQALADMQSQIPAAVTGYDQYCNNMKDVVMEKLAAGGTASEAILAQALTSSLSYAVSNKLFTEEGSASLAASFGVNNGAQPLTDAASLEINTKSQSSAEEFHATLAELLQQQANGGFGATLTTLGAVNVAVMDLLAANGIVQASSLLGLRAFLLG